MNVMSKKIQLMAAALLLFLPAGMTKAQEVTMQSLLREMVNREYYRIFGRVALQNFTGQQL